MTIDDQLRDLADRADQHQRAITAAEIITRASSRQSHGTGSFVTRSGTNDRRRFLDRAPVPLAKEDVTMIDLEPPAHADSHRRRPNRALAAALLAAAALVAVVVVAIRNDDDSTPADEPPPTITAPPRALFGTPDEQFAAGTYAVNVIEGTPTPRIVVTLGSGWTNTTDEWSVGKEGTGFVTFSRPDRVFTDACQSINGFHPGPMTTLDGLVAALSEQGGWAEVTTPSDITVDGYAGRAFQRTAPTEFKGCSTAFAPFRSWENDDPNGLGWSYYEPGEIETLWVLDLDSTVIIVNTRMPAEHRSTAVAELAAVLDSIRIDGGSDTSRVPGSDPIDSE
jgi:hypothetical protein